ncbi:SH3 domain-containing protein [Flavobacteriaceae bacterium M23B6Z8]
MKKYIPNISLVVLVCFAIFQTSCKTESPEAEVVNKPDNESLLEKVSFYTVEDLNFDVFEPSNKAIDSFYNKTYDPSLFLKKFYLPWKYKGETDTTRISEIWEEHFTYEKGIAANSPCYTGNLREYSAKYINELNEKLPARTDISLNPMGFGITTETTDVKGLPTDEFCFKNIRNSGEGYPFDYLQYTTLWVGTPITILEKSKDHTWYFVKSTYTTGWVRSKSIALADQQQINTILNSQKVVVTGDNVRLKGAASTYKVFTGTFLPYDAVNQEILYPTRSPLDNKLVFDRIKSQSSFVREFPIEFNKENVKTILTQMIGGKYSWGGIDGGRDCSSTLKDYFTPFGIWTPRNSKAQRFSGQVDSLQHLTPEQKKQDIANKGIPFVSTLYLPGHIVLYVGSNKNSKMQMYHTVWGLKAYHSDPALSDVTKSREYYGIYGVRDRENDQVETRSVIGRTVITDIELDKAFKDMPDLWVKPFLENMETLTNPITQ